MQFRGRGIQSFEAIAKNIGIFVKHTCPLKNYYWYFSIPHVQGNQKDQNISEKRLTFYLDVHRPKSKSSAKSVLKNASKKVLYVMRDPHL